MSKMSESAIEIVDLVKTYAGPDGAAVRVLSISTLRLMGAARLAIAGPSGSGKTTLFHIVAGLLRPTSGTVRVLGERIDRLSEAALDRFRACHIGYIFQVSNLLPGFSAIENVLLAMEFADAVPPRQRSPRASELLERVGLGARLHYRPAQLSSGQQQRVAVARALANSPSLLLADEPTAHIDYATGRQVTALLRELCAEQHAALLLASHDRELLNSFSSVFELRAPGLDGSEAVRQGDKVTR